MIGLFWIDNEVEVGWRKVFRKALPGHNFPVAIGVAPVVDIYMLREKIEHGI